MYSHYLSTFIAKALVETLDVKVRDRSLTPTQAQFILSKFYESIPKVFNTSVVCTMNFKAKMLSYNFVDGVWKFIAKDFGMSINNKVYRTDYIRIIAKDAETNTEVRRRKRK
jgi:transcription initiation factor TFIIA small subunit